MIVSKGGLIIGGIAAIGAAFGITKLMSKKHAADKLQISFKKIRILQASFVNGITFEVFLNAINSAPTELAFTQPFVQIFIQDDVKGDFYPIASSDSSKQQITLPAKESSEIPVRLNMSAMQALKLPKLLSYLINQFLSSNPKKTKKILVEYSTKALGVNISGKTEVLI